MKFIISPWTALRWRLLRDALRLAATTRPRADYIDSDQKVAVLAAGLSEAILGYNDFAQWFEVSSVIARPVANKKWPAQTIHLSKWVTSFEGGAAAWIVDGMSQERSQDIFMALGTHHYGEDTGNDVCTANKIELWQIVERCRDPWSVRNQPCGKFERSPPDQSTFPAEGSWKYLSENQVEILWIFTTPLWNLFENYLKGIERPQVYWIKLAGFIFTRMKDSQKSLAFLGVQLVQLPPQKVFGCTHQRNKNRS